MGRLSGLDGLRGIASLMVVVFHASQVSGVTLGADRFYLAVDFFFVLSGFVMARTYEARFAQGYRPIAFLADRFKRFFTVMAIGTLIGFAVVGANYSLTTGALLAVMGLLFVPMLSGPVFPLNFPAWSIFCELTANAAHGSVLWRMSARILVMISLLAGGFLLLVGSAATEGLNSNFGLPRILVSYTIGIVLWRRQRAFGDCWPRCCWSASRWLPSC